MSFKVTYLDFILLFAMILISSMFFIKTKSLKEQSDENASQADSLYVVTLKQEKELESLRVKYLKLYSQNDSIIDAAIRLTNVKVSPEDKKEAIEWLKEHQY